jgi:nucleoside-diphosphate-sugar epimerase
MKVLVLGGSGHVGARLCAMLRETGWATPVSASRRATAGVEHLRVDTRDAAALRGALRGVDAVVNCVAGNAEAIADGARLLSGAALAAGCERLVHLSSMVVYGPLEGRVDETAALDPSLGWYARAKCEAEAHMAAYAQQGGSVTLLRPGCVCGPGSDLWVGRIGRFLKARRLGDLGVAGDGWSNLVHVDDVCSAVIAALRQPAAAPIAAYNLAAPDSPRWNEYFVDLALEIGATPVRRLSPRRLQFDAFVAGPPLKLAEAIARRVFGARPPSLPPPLPPNLLGLWERHLQLDSSRAERELGLQWTPYALGLQQSAAWFLREHSAAPAKSHTALQEQDSRI